MSITIHCVTMIGKILLYQIAVLVSPLKIVELAVIVSGRISAYYEVKPYQSEQSQSGAVPVLRPFRHRKRL